MLSIEAWKTTEPIHILHAIYRYMLANIYYLQKKYTVLAESSKPQLNELNKEFRLRTSGEINGSAFGFVLIPLRMIFGSFYFGFRDITTWFQSEIAFDL